MKPSGTMQGSRIGKDFCPSCFIHCQGIPRSVRFVEEPFHDAYLVDLGEFSHGTGRDTIIKRLFYRILGGVLRESVFWMLPRGIRSGDIDRGFVVSRLLLCTCKAC